MRISLSRLQKSLRWLAERSNRHDVPTTLRHGQQVFTSSHAINSKYRCNALFQLRWPLLDHDAFAPL